MRHCYKAFLLFTIFAGIGALTMSGDNTRALAASTAPPEVMLVDLNGPVGPASVDLIIRSIEQANQLDREAVVLRINTPGGLDKAMRDLVQAILASNVPIITYVAPNGARAASAGTYIAYASHIAAMAPATNIGSSTPVSLAPQGLPSTPGLQPPKQDDDATDSPLAKPSATAPPVDAMSKKVINDAVAYLQGLAELRGRNIQWAESTVRDGANLRASEAQALGVIDLIATDINALLQQIDGRSVTIKSNQKVLRTANAVITVVESDWRHDLLETITDPSIAYGLLIVGLYALMLEFYNPGLIIPAMTGIILILLGAYGLQLLPVNYAGVALVVLGIILLVAEVITPTFGVLGIGGLASFVLGSMIMFDSDVPGVSLPIGIIAGFTLTTGMIVVSVVGLALRARNAKVVSGTEAMIGAQGHALSTFKSITHLPADDSSAPQIQDLHYFGDVRAFGEIWQARSQSPISSGDTIRVEAIDGLTLDVIKEN